MRTTSLRSLHLDGPGEFLVQVTHNKEVVGTFVPVGVASPESIEWALVGTPVVARTERISVVTATNEIGYAAAFEAPAEPPVNVEAEVVRRMGPALGEVAVAAPIAKHQTQDELDAARAARNKALDDARKAKQQQQAEWSRKALRGGGA
jgi:hypothetical protein